VYLLCALPVVLNMLNVEFSFQGGIRYPSDVDNLGYNWQLIYQLAEGVLVHTILEWSSFCIALFTVVFAFTHYSVTRDLTTPIIGTALFLSGTLDAVQLLFADSLLQIKSFYGYAEFATNFERRDFVFFSSSFSRTFNACVLIAGIAPFLGKPAVRMAQHPRRGLRFALLAGILFTLMSLAIVTVFATARQLPRTVFLDSYATRPWDIMPLVLYLFAGLVIFPRFYKLHPSLFSHALIVSVVPNIASEFYAAFGSKMLYDNNFNVSLYLKNIAYLVPLGGLILDYTRAYRTEVTLRSTQEMLEVARRVQQGLLPQEAPQTPGYELDGDSSPAEAVGGDYFDFIPMHDGRLGIVVADVSGHEVGASILMAQTRAYLRALAASREDLSTMMSRTNEFLSRDVQNRWFVTLFFVQLNVEAGTFEYAAAGHEGYLLKQSGEVETFESTSPPLGVLDGGTLECGPQCRIEPGDILLLMTDGIAETVSPAGEQFGLQRVFETVKSHRHLSPREIISALNTAATRYRGSATQLDDVTTVVLKRKVTKNTGSPQVADSASNSR
jgi:hypothetical protein